MPEKIRRMFVISTFNNNSLFPVNSGVHTNELMCTNNCATQALKAAGWTVDPLKRGTSKGFAGKMNSPDGALFFFAKTKQNPVRAYHESDSRFF
jgi:hypothetical protein